MADVKADAGTQTDGLEKLAELSKHASPKDRARLEETLDAAVQSRRTRSITCKTVRHAGERLASAERGTLLTELHIMDEERRSLAELQITSGRGSE